MTADADAARIAELENDNRRLRRLLDGRDAPGELRHRLRSTLALLRAVLHRSAATTRDPAGFVAHLEDRLDAIARAQNLADQHGEIDLWTLIADELLHYGVSEGERLLLGGPEVRLQPRVGQILALAIHELAVNAVEHGVLGLEDGRVEVSWSVMDGGSGHRLTLNWVEQGLAFDAGPAYRGFGTEVLTQMLPYSVGAETETIFGLKGLFCTIRFPVAFWVGGVVAGWAAVGAGV